MGLKRLSDEGIFGNLFLYAVLVFKPCIFFYLVGWILFLFLFFLSVILCDCHSVSEILTATLTSWSSKPFVVIALSAITEALQCSSPLYVVYHGKIMFEILSG